MRAVLRKLAVLLGGATAAVAECHPVQSDSILARDLAAAAPAFAAAPPAAVFAFSPRPGAQRIATNVELNRFARAHGIAGQFESLCFVRAAAPPDRELAVAAMRNSLGMAGARIEIVDISRFPAPPGTMVFPRESLVEPFGGDVAVWNGYVVYDGGRFGIWAKARIAVPVTRVVASASLKAGQIVGQSDVRVETADDFPRRSAPLASDSEAIGRVARRSIPAGSPIVAAALGEPNAVERGQTIMVEARSGAAVVAIEAKAEAAGRRGDIIPLRNATSGKLFKAQIEDKGRASLECRRPENSK